jgi:calcium-dependent protein kinase
VPKVKHVCVQSAGLLVDSILKRDVNTPQLKEVGQVQFSTPYVCVKKATGREFAWKSIAKRKLLTEEDVRREIQFMHPLTTHNNVVSIVGAYEDAVATLHRRGALQQDHPEGALL